MTFGHIIYVKHDCKRRELVINQRLNLIKNVVCNAKKLIKGVIQGPFRDTCK